MKFSEAIDSLGKEEAKKHAEAAAKSGGVKWQGDLEIIFDVCLKDPERRPRIGGRNDTANAAIDKWVKKYSDGYKSRPSVCRGKACQTMPDEIIDDMILSRLDHLEKDKIDAIKYAHRLSMAAENVLGDFLEEYVAIKLKPYGWQCAWGNSLKAVDMCHSDGRLLQIKNRSNTENSSSVRVRDGTSIKKWYRVDANSGQYLWQELEALTGAQGLSEKDFRDFVLSSIKKNPNCLVMEPESPWGCEN